MWDGGLVECYKSLLPPLALTAVGVFVFDVNHAVVLFAKFVSPRMLHAWGGRERRGYDVFVW